jgi:hypothetical protein
MKKGRRYIEPMLGRGDKKDKKKPTTGVSDKPWDGTSRPSNDLYRENFDKIFKGGK